MGKRVIGHRPVSKLLFLFGFKKLVQSSKRADINMYNKMGTLVLHIEYEMFVELLVVFLAVPIQGSSKLVRIQFMDKEVPKRCYDVNMKLVHNGMVRIMEHQLDE
jgi:hypothetical protein